MGEKTASGDGQTESIHFAFCELAKLLGKRDFLEVTQLAASLETKAREAKTSAETRIALEALALKLRNP